MRRTIILGLLVSLFAVGPARAQKVPHDPRPLHGLDRGHIPTYSSLRALLQARPPSARADLRARATVVGTADFVTQPMAMHRAMTGGAVASPAAALDAFRVIRAHNGTIRWMKGRLGAVATPGSFGKQGAAQVARAAQSMLTTYADILRLENPDDELQALSVVRDDLGYVHARFEQVYQGVPVWGRDLYVHVDADGQVYAVNGAYEPTPRDLAATPDLSAETARQIVIDDLKARGKWAPVSEEVANWLDLGAPAARLVFYPDDAEGLRLAYEVTLHPNLLEQYTYLVDAQTGRVLNNFAQHCSLWHEAPLQAAQSYAVAPSSLSAGKSGASGTFFDADAADLNGQAQALRVYQNDGDNLFYKLWDLDNLNMGQSQLPDNPTGGALTITANGTDLNEQAQLAHVTSGDNTWTDPAGVSAHVNMNIAYTYYKQKHNRNAIDGQDQSIISVIHVTDEGRPMDNAFWNGRVMAYGDGGQVFKPLAGALDVAGHEMTHGVIQNTAGLVYQFQSGALNESFADVFGVMIEPNDFLLGEDIMQPGRGAALRDLLNPDNPQVLSAQPAHMSQFRNLGADQDNGGVHINSGIPNRAAALITQILDIGPTEEIYYRALTVYLTRNSQFGDARLALEQAAVDLFGEGSGAVTAVRQSFDDVGILSTTGSGAEEGNDLPPQVGGASLIAVLLEDGTLGMVDVSDPNSVMAGTFTDPAAVARVDAENGDRAQLTTPRDGETIWFINEQGQLAFIEVANGRVSVFEDLFLDEPGDLWNASIAPGEDFVALVSAYENDPTLYIFDGEDVFAIDLVAETSQDGIEDQAIQYPDVVSWSPNPQVPRIAFDAFNEVPFAFGSGVSYWSMYEIDFTAGTIFNLIPAQPTNLSVGNITYSNTDPDLVAFNVIDETGTWDVVVGNFASGEMAALDLPSFTVNGTSVTDAQRPTFSPGDELLGFTSPSLGMLLFFDGQNLNFLDFQQPLYNPTWFVQGGSGGVSNQAPQAAFSASATAGVAPLSVTFDAAASSDPDGDPLSYRWNFGDGTTGGGVTTTHTFAAVGAFTVTLTVTDSGGLSSSTTRQVVVDAATGTSTEAEDELPREIVLHGNYPNPFNPETVLSFDLPAAAQVDLQVVDLLGRTVAVLVSGPVEAGRHTVRFEAGDLASGIYLARLRAGAVVQTRRMVLLR